MCERIRVGNFFGGGLSQLFLSLVGFPLRDEFTLQVLLDGRRIGEKRLTYKVVGCMASGATQKQPSSNFVFFNFEKFYSLSCFLVKKVNMPNR